MRNHDSMCAYCGKSDVPLTRDHVVPKALWKDQKKPSNLVTVPQCGDCKIYWDAEVPYFRNFVVLHASPEDHPAILSLAYGPVKRSVRRNPSERRDITRGAKPGWKRTPSGLYIEPGIQIQLDAARFERTPEKIIRGLFFARNSYIVPTDHEVLFRRGNEFWAEPEVLELMETMHEWIGMGDDVFQLRSVRMTSDPNNTAWLMLFFRSCALLGFTAPKEAP